MGKKNSVRESMLLKHRNSAQNLDYYADLERFFQDDPATALMKLRSFALYTPRQVVSDFLARYELFSRVVNLPGSIVECGVFNGQGLLSFALFSSILEPNNVNRIIYGIDTFGGFPGISSSDKGGASDRMKRGGYAAKGSWARINEAIALFDRNRFIGHVPKIQLVRGDVTKTLDRFIDEHPHLLIALLYLDLDLYKPTKAVLKKLLPRAVKGSVIAFDELNVRDYPGETAAMLESIGTGNVKLMRVPFCSRICYFVK